MTAATSDANRAGALGRLPGIIGANGWFSIVSGTALLVGAAILDDWFDLPAWVIAVVGAALIPYGLVLRRAARSDLFDRRVAWLATVGDLAWVVAAITLITVPNTMSTAGKWTLAIVSLAVLDFAVIQLRELRRSSYSVPGTRYQVPSEVGSRAPSPARARPSGASNRRP